MSLGDRPLMNAPLPGEPAPSWPGEPHVCPRCGSPDTTLDEVNYRFLLLTFLKATTCNRCKHQFSARTGTSTMPILIAAYVVPFAIFFLVAWLVFFRAR